MKLRVREWISLQGDGAINEDLFGYTGNACWIIDGATPIDASHLDPVSDASWLAHFVDDQLRARSPEEVGPRLGSSLSQIAADVAVALAASNFPAERVPPACSLGVLTLKGSHLSWGTVGDVLAIVARAGRDPLHWQNKAFKSAESLAMKSVPRGLGSVEALERGAEGIRQRRRAYISGMSDQMVFSNNPDVGTKIRPYEGEVADGDVALLMTDGFARLVDTYHLYRDWNELLASCSSDGLENIAARLRTYEQRVDRTGRSHFKSKDDATAALVDIGT
ncbi:protein phosphatase 2C domain-containing protein [Kineosporia sp. J2-2]|uniref:Protein phosphatase 2C domain-containing protein n=1 Tax=Kineosporia corallincola TaxID=2835133 RepID=A0ABS5TTT3_9ACTN|nr:protein phosphatase 2C domain-containing protein [Kineosporia corallincola]MBT0774227.1 protein phosphatase 2C domain-containing protein [Kineosporia corallincola]